MPSRLGASIFAATAPTELARFAAIDVGSNAVRLLVATAEADSLRPRKSLLFRMPLRLGAEAFSGRRLSATTVARLIDVLRGFSSMLRALDIAGVRACATSALREAENRDEVVAEAREACGLRVEVLDGRQEVELLCANFREHAGVLLTADVGGGSTDLALLADGEPRETRSFEIGTVRALLDGDGDAVDTAGMAAWLGRLQDGWPGLSVHGSGGNIRKIGKLAGRCGRVDKPALAALARELAASSLKERMRRWSMPADRADTILPAARIFLAILDATGRDSVAVSKLGLADAMVREMAERHWGCAVGDGARAAAAPQAAEA